MSALLAGLVASSFDQSDWLKLLGIAGAAVALYLVAKHLGGAGDSYPSPTQTPDSTQLSASQTEGIEPEEDQQEADQGDLEGSDDEAYTTEEGAARSRDITIADWSFASFEVADGPPDRNAFAEELQVGLHDKSTGQTWKQDYFVATPAGLEKMLHDSKSSFLSFSKILVMNRYDPKTLRLAVLEDLATLEEERGDVPPDAIDEAAAGGQ